MQKTKSELESKRHRSDPRWRSSTRTDASSVFFRSWEKEIRGLIPVVDISEHTSIAMWICSEQGSSVSGEQREEMMLSRNVGEAAKKFRNLCSGVRGLVETVMGLESKRGKETLREREREK
ncbi:hypothetical protein V8G54_029411 [Vigna mungo]|uniref:Uncharacterized protein n=1 Tax=Vigna mungo TaxID=3915 RepID=A0AAQ3MUK4_VIGMU